MKHKLGCRSIAVLLLIATFIGLIPCAFAAEDGEILEPVFDPAVEEPTPDKVGTPADADLDLYGNYNLPPEDDMDELEESDLEEEESDWEDEEEFLPEDYTIYSDDGQELTREEGLPLYPFISLFASNTATIGKSTCVNFPAYTSPYWYCNRYYTDGVHSYGHYFYAATMSYHTINGSYAYCIEPNTSSAAGASYTSYSSSEASSASYWMKELDATQRSHIQKILAFGYPACDYGYSARLMRCLFIARFHHLPMDEFDVTAFGEFTKGRHGEPMAMLPTLPLEKNN